MKLWVIFLLGSATLVAGDVIDVGTLKIDGVARGPHTSTVDSNRVGDELANRMVNRQLKKLEEKLLNIDLSKLISGEEKP